MIRPEIDPGPSTQRPATANLVKLKLEPGAVWEVTTQSAIHYVDPNRKIDYEIGSLEFEPIKRTQPAIAEIYSAKPNEALITWELRTANGAEYTEDQSDRIWPAKGGWSGVLCTSAARVKLVAAK